MLDVCDSKKGVSLKEHELKILRETRSKCFSRGGGMGVAAIAWVK